MSKAKKCDRCGNFYEHYNSNDIIHSNGLAKMYCDKYENYHYHDKGRIDLCPECKASFDKWLGEPLNANVISDKDAE